jgi:hypothetical protein
MAAGHASASVQNGAEARLPVLRRRRRRLQVHGVRPAAVQAGWHVVWQVQRAHWTCSSNTAPHESPNSASAFRNSGACDACLVTARATDLLLPAAMFWASTMHRSVRCDSALLTMTSTHPSSSALPPGRGTKMGS